MHNSHIQTDSQITNNSHIHDPETESIIIHTITTSARCTFTTHKPIWVEEERTHGPKMRTRKNPAFDK